MRPVVALGAVAVVAALGMPAAPAAIGGTIGVVGCPARAGVPGQPLPRIPARLGATVSGRTAARLRAYSDGDVVVLGPRGWRCTGLDAADGGASLSVVAPGQPDPLTTPNPARDAAAVTARFDYTGHGPGAALVCGLFPSSAAARLAASTGGCSSVPARELVRRPTPDAAAFVDPPGVRGTGDPSGGVNVASGAVLFPQLSPEPGSVNVAKVTCTLPRSLLDLCPAIVSDFVTRARQRPLT